jgi:hypothetical protein
MVEQPAAVMAAKKLGDSPGRQNFLLRVRSILFQNQDTIDNGGLFVFPCWG